MKENKNPDVKTEVKYETKVDLDFYSLEEALKVKSNLIDEWPAPARVRMRPVKYITNCFRVWVRVPVAQ